MYFSPEELTKERAVSIAGALDGQGGGFQLPEHSPESAIQIQTMRPENGDDATVHNVLIDTDCVPLTKTSCSFEPDPEPEPESHSGSGAANRPKIRTQKPEMEAQDGIPTPEKSQGSEPDVKKETQSPSRTKTKSKKHKPSMPDDLTTLTSVDLDAIPLPKSSYAFDPDRWDDADFDPFGGKNKMQTDPAPSKMMYGFDPENFDDSVDPFKPRKTLANADPKIHHAETQEEEQNKDCLLVEERNARQVTRKNKNKIIT